MLVFWYLLVDEHHVGGDGVGLVLDPLPLGLHVGGDGLSLVCLQLGLGHPPPGHHVDDGRPPAPLQTGLAHVVTLNRRFRVCNGGFKQK